MSRILNVVPTVIVLVLAVLLYREHQRFEIARANASWCETNARLTVKNWTSGYGNVISAKTPSRSTCCVAPSKASAGGIRG
jgi:hypothetical protein